jgi:recombinational DNA repair protein (RecF pathway)
VAAGVCKSASKLRYHTQDFSVRQFSLVRGRDIWRLVGVEEIRGVTNLDPTSLNGVSYENIVVYARVISLIRRLIRGEEKNEPIFLTLFSLYNLLVKISKDGDDTDALETLAVFRILHSLGYIKSDKSTESLIVPLEINSDLVATAKPLVPSLISSINKGLTESHL